jgi:hypothetical protein
MEPIGKRSVGRTGSPPIRLTPATLADISLVGRADLEGGGVTPFLHEPLGDSACRAVILI